MAVNDYRPHLFVIPEDDANRQFATGFERDDRIKTRAIQVMPSAGGWLKVINKIRMDYVPKVRSNPYTHVVGIFDCDEEPGRIAEQIARIPEDVRDRIFLLGTLDDPQAFRNEAGLSFEEIGISLADECFQQEFSLWRHPQLAHIGQEIDRAAATLRPILFAQ